jgi:peptidoglycan/LPS O-acetylase OafA/YrhL
LNYRPEIDGLRALAVMPVILFHAGFSAFKGGYVGVDIFFVISGYLITSIILADLAQGRFSLLGFYERRARRILPALFFVTFACIPVAWWLLLPADLQNFAQSLVAVATFSSNILFWLESGYFDTAAELKPLLHTWSLAVEEQYYLLFPLLLMLLWKAGRRWLWGALAVVFVASLWASAWGVEYSPVATFYLLPARGWELLVGVFIALAMWRRPAPHASRFVGEALAIGGIVLIAFAVFTYDEQTLFPGLAALAPVVGTGMVILYARDGTLVKRWLSARLLVGIGLVSYSAYLWHHPIFAFAKYRSVDGLDIVTTMVLFFATWPLAYLSWRYVEGPFRNRRNFNRSAILLGSTAGIALLAASGLYGHLSVGVPSRLDAQQLPVYEALMEAKQERILNIRSGTCHFNEKGQYAALQDFVEHWDCRSPDRGDGEILVFGDSHSADKAFALRQAGVPITQLGGSNCPLVPSFVTPVTRHCDALFELARSLNGPDVIMLSGRFTESLLTEAYLAEIIRYWNLPGRRIVLFSPMPDFARPIKETLLYGAPASPPSLSRERKFFELLERISLPPNFTIIKTSELRCPPAAAAACVPYDGGNWLMTDADHLSALGAAAFGRELVDLDFLAAPGT